jgi:apolipoprotein N-acyltransferase
MSVTNAARMARRRRQLITYGWIFGLTVLTISLIYWEKTALLYILATAGVTVLLIMVAKADLAHAESMTEQPPSTARPADR